MYVYIYMYVYICLFIYIKKLNQIFCISRRKDVLVQYFSSLEIKSNIYRNTEN